MSSNQELLNIFLEEATDLVASLSSTLRAWEAELTNLSKIGDLKRDLHTVKGSARMVGQMNIGTLAHEMETLTEAMAKGQIKVEKPIFDLVCLGLDQISLMVEALKKGEVPPSAESLIQQFHQYLPEGAKAAAPPAAPTSTETKGEAAKAEVPSAPSKPEDTKRGLAEEVVRIKANLLETLNNLSTENSMMRVGLEQHIEAVGTFLREMKQETRRLELQLNTLSSEIQSYVVGGESYHVPPIEEYKTLTKNRFMTIDQISHVIRETTLDIDNILKGLVETHAVMETMLLNQGRISAELQHRLSDTRLVPFESIVPRLSRIARQVSLELKKQVDFKVLKSEGEMDRTVLEHLVPSLEHILRNALDHGIESSEERRKKGKSEVGKIEISFIRAGSTAAIKIQDDGGGINADAIRKKAIKLGMLSPDATITDEEAMRYILEPGFSTREAVTELSGRGVGMDVVNTAVKEMGGNLDIESKPGQGTTFTIRFPFTASLNRILIFKIQNETYGMLLTSIDSVTTITVEQLETLLVDKKQKFEHGGKSYSLHYLGLILESEDKSFSIPKRKSFPLVLFSASNYPVAFVVDSILYSRELVVQALGAQFKLMNECSGATLLGDGTVVLILDPVTLSMKAKAQAEREQGPIEVSKERKVSVSAAPLVLVVDDSVSARTVMKRLLEQEHYQVITAKDGLDALTVLETHSPDIILSDIDMPRMDGFEFADQVRREERFKDIPIVVITSRASPQHIQRAKDMNLNGFIEKPFQEAEFLATIESLLGKKT